MISISKLFQEMANVHAEHPSGIVAPFGIVNPSEKNKITLSQFQNMNKLDLDSQAREMNKLRGN